MSIDDPLLELPSSRDKRGEPNAEGKKSSWLLGGFIAIAALTSTPVIAHDIWATVHKTNDGKVVADIGYGDRDNRSVPDPEKMVAMDLIGPSGTTHLRNPLKLTTWLGQPVLETRAFAIKPGSILTITYDNGFWVRMPGDKGQTNTTTLISPGGTDQHWTMKFSKMLFGTGAYKQVFHQRLELTALKDPFGLKKGDMLPVRVDYEGKPVSGILVQYEDGISPVPDARAPKVKAGADGVALVPLGRIGPYLLVVDTNEPPRDTHFANYDHLFASMSFDLTK